jgi:hypothetical protein
LAVLAAEENLSWIARIDDTLVYHLIPPVAVKFPYYPSAMAVAALAAGPGSDLQQQLLSLLCTMAKLGSMRPAVIVPDSIATASLTARGRLTRAAACTAAALAVLPPPGI